MKTDGQMTTLTISPARYRRGFSVLRTPSDGSGFKTRLMFAIEKCGGKWTHRDGGYQMPEKKAAKVFKLLQRYERKLAHENR